MAWAERQSQLRLGIRYQNAAYQDWSLKVASQEEKNAVINGQVSDLFRVPVDIWHVIPPEVRMVMVSNNPRWGGDNTPGPRGAQELGHRGGMQWGRSHCPVGRAGRDASGCYRQGARPAHGHDHG